MPHVAVIDPGVNQAEVSCFNRLVDQHRQFMFTYHLPVLAGMSSLNNIEPHAVLIFGSAASVHDQLTWQDQLKDWLTNYIDKGGALFGFCYAHQLVAAMYGGTVTFWDNDHTKLKGLRSISFEKNLFNQAGELSLVVSHREVVTKAPQGFDVWASSREVAIDGLVHRSKPIWTLQSHPEADRQFMVNQDIPFSEHTDVFDHEHDLITSFLNTVKR